MGKAFKYMFGIGAAIVAIGVAVFLIFTYWEKILAYTTAGARVASNILKTLSGDTDDTDDPSDYYDILSENPIVKKNPAGADGSRQISC